MWNVDTNRCGLLSVFRESLPAKAFVLITWCDEINEDYIARS